MFRLTMFISVIITLSFGININEATRYDLMSYGGLDAGRADMLIKERTKKEITKQSDLKRIYGFKDYNISKLAQNFEIEPLPKPEPKKPESKPEVKVIEKNNYIYKNYPPYYENRTRYGDIEIIERGSYGSEHYGRFYDKKFHSKEALKPNNRKNGVEVGGFIDLTPKKDKSFEKKIYIDGKEIYKNSSHYFEDGGAIMGGSIRYKGEF